MSRRNLSISEPIDIARQDPGDLALSKFKWGGHTPHGEDTIKRVEKFLLPLARSSYIKSVLYKGGGSLGVPLEIKISQKVDNPRHLNLKVLFKSHSVNFIAILTELIPLNRIEDLIQHYRIQFAS